MSGALFTLIGGMVAMALIALFLVKK